MCWAAAESPVPHHCIEVFLKVLSSRHPAREQQLRCGLLGSRGPISGRELGGPPVVKLMSAITNVAGGTLRPGLNQRLLEVSRCGELR